MLDFGEPASKRARLYEPTEMEVKPWVNMFNWTHQDEDCDEVVTYIGFSIGADGLFSPTAKVVEDGWVLEVRALVAANRVELNKMYKARRAKQFNKLISPDVTEGEKVVAKNMYDWLGSRRTAEMNSVTLMKNDHSDNWKLQFLRIPLEQQVEKKIATNEILGDTDGGLVLSIDLKVIRDNFLEAAEAKMASPSK